jgi:hypothetical protein
MIASSAPLSAIARRAVLAIVIATAAVLGSEPANAGLLFDQLLTMQSQRINNENARHQAVLKELALEGQMADNKLTAQLKICTTASCKAAQRADNLRTHNQLDTQEEHENAAHAAKLAQIKADFAAEEKANGVSPPAGGGAPKPGAVPTKNPDPD